MSNSPVKQKRRSHTMKRFLMKLERMLEVGRGSKSSEEELPKKAKEKFELVNIILPEISKKSSELLGGRSQIWPQSLKL